MAHARVKIQVKASQYTDHIALQSTFQLTIHQDTVTVFTFEYELCFWSCKLSDVQMVTCFTSEERCTVACVASFLAMHYRLSLSNCVSTRLSRVSGPRYLQYVYFLWLCLKRFVGFITRSLLFFLRLFSYVKCTLPRFFFYTIL